MAKSDWGEGGSVLAAAEFNFQVSGGEGPATAASCPGAGRSGGRGEGRGGSLVGFLWFPFGLQAQSSPRREAELGRGGGRRLARAWGRCGEKGEMGIREGRGCPVWGAGSAPALPRGSLWHPGMGARGLGSLSCPWKVLGAPTARGPSARYTQTCPKQNPEEKKPPRNVIDAKEGSIPFLPKLSGLRGAVTQPGSGSPHGASPSSSSQAGKGRSSSRSGEPHPRLRLHRLPAGDSLPP